MRARRAAVPLAAAQLLSWGSLYYGITFLAPPIHEDTGWGLPGIFGAFSLGLLASALAAAPVGRLLARHGGRRVMSAGSLLAAAAFLLMAWSPGLAGFHAAWLVAGLAMALTLYEAAFSTLRQCAGEDFRRALGIVTLVGGLASTVFWPLTHGLVELVGWRATLLVFAGLHLAVGLPLHRALPVARPAEVPPAAGGDAASRPGRRRALALLAAAFAAAGLVASGVSAGGAVILAGMGVPAGQAMLAMSLIGPMQVAGRLAEWRLASRVPVAATGRLAFLALAGGTAALAATAAGAWLVFAFALLYGAANGVLTVVRGGVPAELLGGMNYAKALGVLSAPGLAARAAAPLAAAAVLEAWGATATAVLLLAAAAAGLALFVRGARAAAGGR